MASLDDAQEARRLVQHISEKHGYLSEEWTRAAIPNPEDRRKFVLAMLAKDEMIGSTVITLARNLYSSNARFVLEMLQNADDNAYQNARSAGDSPYMSFAVYPDRIVAECNEDGFNEANLSAICSVGKSSKTVAQGYIGEKGIGFKSVFMVAWKVHIQSRAFSFSFSHRQGDSGMGMISPVWEETAADDLPAGVTRITLHLHEEAITGNLRQSINDQFANLQETFLLFMKNLRRVSVAFHEDHNQPPSTSTSYSVEKPQPTRAVVRTSSTDNGTSSTRSSFFHITTRQATGLPRNQNRQYSETELATAAYSTAEVMLAFPLTEESEPVIQPQSLFVFLPVRDVGFNFIIQADFVTDASRQDVVSDSPRNEVLALEIAKTFALAVTQLCEDSKLLYQWIKYLPPRNDPHRGPLWSVLVEKLATELGTTPCLVGRTNSQLYTIPNLLRPDSNILDQNGELLLREGRVTWARLISSTYTTVDLRILQSYGLRSNDSNHVLEWIRNDLNDPFESRIRSENMPDDWHRCMARLLKHTFLKKWLEVTSLELVPLADGRWVSTTSQPVYSKCANGLDIPPGLGLRRLSPRVVNDEMLQFYETLGVRTATVDLIMEEMQRFYRIQAFPGGCITLNESRAHLEFLYQSNGKETANVTKCDWLIVLDSHLKLRSPFKTTVYMQTDDPYGPWQLFRKTDPGITPGSGAPGFADALFLHADYFKTTPEPSRHMAWTDWLQKAVGIQTDVTFDNFEEHGKLRYIHDHRPEKFMGALRESHMKHTIPSCLVAGLQDAKVLCRGGGTEAIKFTYFPTEQLQQRLQRFVGTDEGFPWLWMDNVPEGKAHHVMDDSWKSLLETLQVCIPPNDTAFALTMLKHFCSGISDEYPANNVDKLFGLYRHLASRYQESDNREESSRMIRNFFRDDAFLYIPRDGNFAVAKPEKCVWSAPEAMRSKHVLSLLWENCFQDETDQQSLSSFFREVVGVPNCSYETYTEELRACKSSKCEDIDFIKIWYKEMDKARPKRGTGQSDLRKPFVDEALIYLPSENDGESWHEISNCVWSGAATLRNKASLNEEYSDLEKFFVDFVGVRRIDLEMAVTELKDAAGRHSFDDVQASIWTLNSMLEVSDPKKRLDYPFKPDEHIFPIREPDGRLKCVDTSTQFFVVDRQYEWKAFEDKVRFLGFKLEEVNKLRSFLHWTGLEDRLLSRCVKEVTSLGNSPAQLVLYREQQVANRAHALLRIAVHAGSPRTQGRQSQEALYSLLESTQVYSTDGIASGIQVAQDGKSHMADGKSIAIYLREDSTRLEVYLPRDKKQRRHAFNNILPKKILEWLMTEPATQIRTETVTDNLNAAKGIFTTDRSLLETALEDNGIAAIGIDNRDGNDSSEDASTASDDDAEVVCTPAESAYSRTVSASSRYGYGGPGARPYSYHSSPFDLPMRPAGSSPGNVDDSQYVELLQAVITEARRATLPVFGDVANQVSLDMLSDDYRTFRFRHSSQLERDLKVGAAGELYVFELLSRLGSDGNALPGFTRSNWQSNVRRYVSVHPEYADLTPWSGAETSDLVYRDSSGQLTSRLRAAGYLDHHSLDEAPQYYIEVKATTSSCETPFYMSKAQYARMERNLLSPNGNRDTVYVIFRVYNLGRESMGVKIYMDPETLRQNGSLVFTGEQWSVKPAAL